MEAAIFDLDGTLLDSLGVWGEIDRRFFASRGLELPGDYQGAICGLSFKQTAEYTKERFKLEQSVEDIMLEWHEMCEREYVDEVQLKPGAKEYLARLKQRGVKLAVATTLTQRLYAPALKRNGVYDMFDAFATTDETGQTKLTGEVYRLAAKRLGAEPEACAVYEDISEGLRGAKAAGMRAVLVYDRHNETRLNENLKYADEFIRDYGELL